MIEKRRVQMSERCMQTLNFSRRVGVEAIQVEKNAAHLSMLCILVTSRALELSYSGAQGHYHIFADLLCKTLYLTTCSTCRSINAPALVLTVPHSGRMSSLRK